MKKLFFLIVFVCSITFSANAQLYKHSIGATVGYPTGFEFKSFVTQRNALDIVMGTNFNGFSFTGAYLWNFEIPGQDFQWYIGPASAMGLWDDSSEDGFFFAVYGGGGIEYKFDDIPLVISFDCYPVGVSFVKHSGYDFQCRAGVRYTF